MSPKLKKFFIRLSLVYLWHLMIKWGDETFHDFFDFSKRGILLSLYIVGLWMFALYLLDYIKPKLFQKRKWFPYLLFHIFYGYFFALLTNVVYRFVDTNYFGTDWGEIGYFNPTLTLALTLIFIVNVGIYEYFKSDIQAKENQIKAEKLQKENAIAQYKLLKAQIEPHFLFNSLSVLSSLVHKDANLAEEFIVKLSKLMRFAIEETDAISVTLREELDFMMNYFFLIKIRFEDAISIQNQIQLPTEDYIVPPYTLQTLVENAIQHNKFNSEKPLEIKVYNDEQWIWIENTINEKKSKSDSTGIGLANLNKRIYHLSQRNIEIYKNKGNFMVGIPLILKADINESSHL